MKKPPSRPMMRVSRRQDADSRGDAAMKELAFQANITLAPKPDDGVKVTEVDLGGGQSLLTFQFPVEHDDGQG